MKSKSTRHQEKIKITHALQLQPSIKFSKFSKKKLPQKKKRQKTPETQREQTQCLLRSGQIGNVLEPSSHILVLRGHALDIDKDGKVVPGGLVSATISENRQ
jgi:hypothetical protein